MNDAPAPALPNAADRDASEGPPPQQITLGCGSNTFASNEQAKQAQRQLKIKFFDHLIRDVDIMIYCELSILYYMEYVFLHARILSTSGSLSVLTMTSPTDSRPWI